MKQATNISSDNKHFLRFVLNDHTNRRYLWIALAGTILQFIMFKLLYPYPDFFSDSYSYIYAASANLDINIWPIGYSKFLRVFHFITHSDNALVAFQYFFLQLSMMYLFVSVRYFFKPVKATANILYIFLFFNPLSLYLANYVNSDPLFAAISILWFTQLLWIIYRPAKYQIIVQAAIVFAAFTVRNNAYYYPIISAIAFLLSRQRVTFKLAGIIVPLLFIVPFILYTRQAGKVLTGTPQFSLFTGWQLANNALYIYGHTDNRLEIFKTDEARILNKMATAFYKKTTADFSGVLRPYVGNFFIRQREAPLKQYLIRHYSARDEMQLIAAWGKASVIFGEFGEAVIKNNRLTYLEYFILPNMKNYFLPPLEKLEIYNTGSLEVEQAAQQWFDYRQRVIRVSSPNAQGAVLFLYPALFMLVNLYYLGCIVWYVVKKLYAKTPLLFNRSVLLTTALLLTNFIFSISATINVFRYQVFPLIVGCAFLSLLIETIYKKESISISVKNEPALIGVQY